MKTTFTFLPVLILVITSNAQTWLPAADIPTPIRAGNTAAYSKNGDGFLFIVSGRDNNGLITTKHQRYQLSTDQWTDMAPHPTGILGASTAIVRDSLYIIGGLVTTPGNATNRVRRYSINDNTWSQAANFTVNIVDSDAVAYQDSLIYVAAGYSNKLRVYNAVKNTWRDATPLSAMPESISWGSLTVKNDTLVYMCGATGFLSTTYYNTVRIGVIDQNDRASVTWSEATAFPGETRTFFDACPWKDGIIMTGGSTDNTFDTYSGECYHYNAGTDTWTPFPAKPTPWLTGNSGSVIVGDNWQLICASGYATDYLPQTEIFSEAALAVTKYPSDKCDLEQFRFINGEKPVIEFCSKSTSSVAFTIFDLNGRIVANLENIAPFGNVQTTTVAKWLSAGIYFCKAVQGNYVATKKIVISK